MKRLLAVVGIVAACVATVGGTPAVAGEVSGTLVVPAPPSGTQYEYTITRLNGDGAEDPVRQATPTSGGLSRPLAAGIYLGACGLFEGSGSSSHAYAEAYDVFAVTAGGTTTWAPGREYAWGETPAGSVVGDTNANVQGLPAKVGATLTGIGALSGTSFGEVQFKYYWTDWTSVLGQGASYTPAAAQVGRPLALVETVVAPGTDYRTTQVVPLGTVGVGAAPGGTVALTTAAKGGRTYTLSGVPAGFAASIQWLVGGSAKAGATSATFSATRSQVGKTLQAKVTLTAPGYTATTVLSPTVKIGKLVPTVTLKKASRKRITVRVRAHGVTKPTGIVKVKWGSRGWKTYHLKSTAKGLLKEKAPSGFKSGKVKAVYTPTGKTTAKYLKSKTSKTVDVRY
jgi:hypothetical protein